MNENQSVFSPIEVGNTVYKNRIILSPQKPRNCAISRALIHEEMEFWRKFAQGGAGCLTIGATAINPLPDGKGRDASIPVHDDSCLVPLSRFADMTHMYGCKASIEFYACDKPGSSKEQLVEIVPDSVTVDEIRAYVKNFADAAERCVIAGMDAIVIHGAHGHFPAAFFSKAMNKRTDEFSADTLENRARVADMILDAIRERVGRKIVVEWRISINDMYPESPTFDEIVWFVRHIQDRVDIVHASRGLHRLPSHERYLFTPIYTPRGINLEDAAALKAQVSVPVCAVGGITAELAEEYISTGKLDFVAMARELYADPDLPRKAKAGRKDEIRPCVRCNACINNTHVHRMPAYCAVNVKNNREVIFDTFPKPAYSHRVAVVGGGPAGMEAARTAAMRGHKVTLFEKSDTLGGMLNCASVPWFKKDIKDYIDWAVRMTQGDSNITVKLNTEASAELLKAEGFDTVIVANGGTPIMPGFLQDKANVAWIGDVETGRVEPGHRVIVAGAGLTGCEGAWALAESGRDVTVIDMLPLSEIGQGGIQMNAAALKAKLEELGVKIIPEVMLEEVHDNGVWVSKKSGQRSFIPCDFVAVSFGVAPATALGKELADKLDCEVVCVGDCSIKQGTLKNAIYTGHCAAYNIL